MPFDLEEALKSLVTVVPVYEALEFTQRCLSTLDQFYPDRNLVLIDDCSPRDETAKWLRHYGNEHEKTTFFRRPQRGWFTRAVNDGLRIAMEMPGEWVITLNSDCELGAGAFEEMFAVWNDYATDSGKRVGLIASDGPREPAHHRRWTVKEEPGYCTGHCNLMNKGILKNENLRFPQDDGECRGFSAQDLVHISSDRALSWELNRRGYVTIESHWSYVGHFGGKSWGHDIGSIPNVRLVG